MFTMDDEWNNINNSINWYNTLIRDHNSIGPMPYRMSPVPLNSTTVPSPFFIVPSTPFGPIPLSSDVFTPLSLPTNPLTNIDNQISHMTVDNVGAPFEGSCMNTDMKSIYQPHLYGPPFGNNFKNPVIIAAAERYYPDFELIKLFVQSFKTVDYTMQSLLNAMETYNQAMIKLAEICFFLKPFVMKLSATIGSFKLIKWFIMKLFYLLRIVKRERSLSAEEDLWAAITSTNQVIPFNRNSWPLVVFFGLISATPCFVYKLLTSVTPTSSSKKNAMQPSVSDLAPLPPDGGEENDEGLLHDSSQHDTIAPVENTELENKM